PVTVLLPALALLAVMGSPFLRLEMTEADVRVLGPEVEARRGYESLRRDFPEFGDNRVIMAVHFPTAPALTPERIGALYDLSARIEALPHVKKVESIVSDKAMTREMAQVFLIAPPPMFMGQI